MDIGIIFVASTVIMNAGFSLLKKKHIRKEVLTQIINSFRFLTSLASAAALLLQFPTISFYIYVTGCATYTLNVPVIKLKVRLNS